MFAVTFCDLKGALRSELGKLPAAGFRYVQDKLEQPGRRNDRESAEAEKLRAESRKLDAETLTIKIEALSRLVELYRLEESRNVAPLLSAMDALHPLPAPSRKLIDITPSASKD